MGKKQTQQSEQSDKDVFSARGKTALITGAGSGIGAATARQLALAGASVLVSDLNLESAQAVAKELPVARAIQMNVASVESVAQVFDSLASLDILVNNAGMVW